MINVLIVEDEVLIAEAHRAYLSRVEGVSVAGVAASLPRKSLRTS